jgi:hypothetical protein
MKCTGPYSKLWRVLEIMYLVPLKTHHAEIKARQTVATKAGRLLQHSSPFIHIYVEE